MAKTIKFNLIIDNKSIRTIDDLRDNFVIEDILDLYNSKLLQKWLNVRGYSDILERVNSINEETNIGVIKKLIKIFDIESNDANIEEAISILGFADKKKALLEHYDKLNYNAKTVIDDYHGAYNSLINEIIENKNDMPKIKANIKKIVENFMELFKLNYKDLYTNFISNAPLAVFAIIMNEKTRDYFVPKDKIAASNNGVYPKLIEFIDNKEMLKKALGKELKVVRGSTEAYWKDIEPSNKKVMIISMVNGKFVRNAGVFGEEFSFQDINNHFVILNGIDYKSNNAMHELLYMEV